MTIRTDMIELYGNELLFLEPPTYDEAIVGVTSPHGGPHCVVYDAQCIVDILRRDPGTDYDEAWEYFEYNIAPHCVGDHQPVFLFRWWGAGS